MKDKLLLKLMRSRRFQRLDKREQLLEIHDYQWQKKQFKGRSQCDA